MSEYEAIGEALTQVRRELVRSAVDGVAPPHQALAALEWWIDEFAQLPDGTVSDERLARSWGELQLMMVEAGPRRLPDEAEQDEIGPAWMPIRRTIEQGFLALLNRPEWASLRQDFHDEVMPLLAEAVVLTREGRIRHCTEAIRVMRDLASRTSGAPHAWRLGRVAAMQYPHFSGDGWVGRIGVEFSWRSARAVVQALLEAVHEAGWSDLPLVIGYDRRVQANQVATFVTELVTSSGHAVYLCGRDTPTPALQAYATRLLGVGKQAGIIQCSAARMPVADPDYGYFTGRAFQGIRYFVPIGVPPPAWMADSISRRAAELLLDEPPFPHAPTRGAVTMMNPRQWYCQWLIGDMARPVRLPEDMVPAREVTEAYWGRPNAMIVVDHRYGAVRGYLQSICEMLGLPHQILHGDINLLMGEQGAANPEPSDPTDLRLRVRELRENYPGVIGLAFDADAERVSVVDEHGTLLSDSAVFALLTDFLLHEAFPDRPGMVARSISATRAVDRLTQANIERTRAAGSKDCLEPHRFAPEYRQLAGDPRLRQAGNAVPLVNAFGQLTSALCGDGMTSEAYQRLQQPRSFADCLEQLLIAGDGQGGFATHGHLLDKDGIWAALLLLQLCAVRHAPPGELWRRLQQEIGPTHAERISLHAPLRAIALLINQYIDQYAHVDNDQLGIPAYQLAGCTVRYAGGIPDCLVEWTLTDQHEHPAILTVQADEVEQVAHLFAESVSPDTTHRLLAVIGERLDGVLINMLKRAETVWQVADILKTTQLPVSVGGEFPATLDCRLAEWAYHRIQELARPGREAPALWQFLLDGMEEVAPVRARILAACHMGEATVEKRTPPVPRVSWDID